MNVDGSLVPNTGKTLVSINQNVKMVQDLEMCEWLPYRIVKVDT